MKHATVQYECYIKPLCQILECNEAWTVVPFFVDVVHHVDGEKKSYSLLPKICSLFN